MSWPMLEKLAISALNAGLKRGRAGTRLPANVEKLDGVVRVARGPGSDDGITDEPLLDVEAFHADQVTACGSAQAARAIVHRMKGRLLGGHLTDAVNTASSPCRVYHGSHVERYVASYRIEYRR